MLNNPTTIFLITALVLLLVIAAPAVPISMHNKVTKLLFEVRP